MKPMLNVDSNTTNDFLLHIDKRQFLYLVRVMKPMLNVDSNTTNNFLYILHIF